MSLAQLGVCYYPEHWPREQWPEQASRMREMGISLVRIGEFAWSRIEPEPGRFNWEWLDTALAALAAESLDVIFCTPTACPPKWLVDAHPDSLPVTESGVARRFGSRRHYRFASEIFRREARRISQAVIERYSDHPAVVGWQLDNEYGCHNTTRSYSEDDKRQFQRWLANRYGDIDTLNQAWGTVFWSQEYLDFSAIELPVATVTEANPAHRLDYWRFASEQVVSFNREQVDVLRERDPERSWVTHNFMGNCTDFDHFAVGADLDIATWDSYPLGFLDQGWFSETEKIRYRRIGHPDWAAFHHDLYRAIGGGRLAVMEQQPGPVNWARSNAQPLAGAARFWGLEAVAHGAEFVSYFRFQQLPFAQEQMHSALHLPDGSPAPAYAEAMQLAKELQQLPESVTTTAPVALVFDYPSCWSTEIQPHGIGCGALETAFTWYQALRQLGLDIDIVSPDTSLAGYRFVVVPALQFIDKALVDRLQASGAATVFGPRTGSRTQSFGIPEQLPPGRLQRLLPIRVIAIDSIRPGVERSFLYEGQRHLVERWYEQVESILAPSITMEDGSGLWYRQGLYHYLNSWLSAQSLATLLAPVARDANLPVRNLPTGLRRRRRGNLLFVMNFGPEPQNYPVADAECLLGGEQLPVGEVAIWKTNDDAPSPTF